MTIITMPTSRRSIFRVKDPLGIEFIEVPFNITLISIEERTEKIKSFF
ncbi:hypothetical protein BCL69_10837 [Nitrosomonas communis]|uniref:Uncharacterized protein n=1 Tax=Nitrosomonas communis TaxID=44574 RepID=A0A5D3Y7S1_9PROT|nr:hypothetical protein BCL69_10837 [Nitrosomonas communis]